MIRDNAVPLGIAGLLVIAVAVNYTRGRLADRRAEHARMARLRAFEQAINTHTSPHHEEPTDV